MIVLKANICAYLRLYIYIIYIDIIDFMHFIKKIKILSDLEVSNKMAI